MLHKWLKRTLLSIFLVVALSQWGLGVYFAASAPTIPDYSHGAIYPKRIHQSTVYLTRTEANCYNDRIFYLGFLSGAPIIFYEVLAQRGRSKKKQIDGS